jgi:D-xylose transport system ATP-binding protein
MADYILEMKGITKEFPGVRALDDVTFQVERGEIHALVGENGAGKSTLMKVLSGIYQYGTYDGDIVFNGEIQKFNTIKDSEHKGIAIIYQELALVKQMTIAENIYLGSEITNRGLLNEAESYKRTQKVLQEVHLDLSPTTKVINLGVGMQQLVEIAKAISKQADLLILDEPSAALTETETDNLLEILRELKNKGVTCIYISHKLGEVFNIADSVTVLRDGKTITTKKIDDINEEQLISYMVGRELTQLFPRKPHKAGETVMSVRNWTVYNPELPDKKLIDNVSFDLKKGEILGIAGLMGAGRTELVMSMFGAYGVGISGEMILEGKKITIRNPENAIDAGIAYVSEDRKRYGLVLRQDIRFNTALASFKRFKKRGFLNDNEIIKQTERYVKELRTKTPSVEQLTKNLSGGNQQKVVLAKWLVTNPKVMIMDEPTRGIDVGAKVEIYNIMNQLIDQGVCIIMISSELPEILGMSDRILVMHQGRLTGEIDWQGATQEKVMYYATGGTKGNEG